MESAAALYGCESILTCWQRGSSHFCCCCCCITAGRNREALLLELRCLTLISQLIFPNVAESSNVAPATWSIRRISQGSPTHFACLECEASDVCSHNFLCLWNILSTPDTHGSSISSFKICAFTCQVQYSTRKGGVCLCFVLAAPC